MIFDFFIDRYLTGETSICKLLRAKALSVCCGLGLVWNMPACCKLWGSCLLLLQLVPWNISVLFQGVRFISCLKAWGFSTPWLHLTKSYTYTMKLNKAGELELPPAKANITYLQNSYNFTVSSRNLTVLVVESLDKKQIATSSPSIPARTSTPGFGGIIASIAFIFIYLIKRKRGALKCV